MVFFVLALLATASVLYARPPGNETVSFYTSDAAAIQTGQDVRVAGVSVGTVKKVEIENQRIRVEATVDDSVFVGEKSRVEVRMLTPVGAYAITLISLGDKPLGGEVISVDRVSVPYSLAEVLQAAPKVTDEVNGEVVKANVEQLAEGLEQNPTSIGSFIDGMNSIVGVLDKQQEQVRQIMGLSAEYLQQFQSNRDFVFEMLRQVEIIVSTYTTWHSGFDESYQNLGDILARLQPFLEYYKDNQDELYNAILSLQQTVGELMNTTGPAIDRLTEIQKQLSGWIGPDGLAELGGGTIFASDVCVPTSEAAC